MKNHRTFSRRLPASATLVVVMFMLALCAVYVQAQETFVVPERYSQDRYEAGWMKNPFTLKTAPVIAEKKSFAKDLVLHNIAGLEGGDALVVLANTKTKEMYRLKKSEPASNGMKIRYAVIKDARRDSYVEVELNGEFAVLRHDDAFRKQMLAGNSARGTRGKGGIGADPGAGGAEGAGKDATGQSVVTPNSTAPSAPGMGGGLPGANAGAGGGARNTTPGPPVERPQPPRGPGPTPPMLRDPSGSGQPVNIRPGPAGMPPQGAPPTRQGRRFFTSPVSVTSVEGAPTSAAP
ncbi:hypothetical protein [Roseimicrobium sp. ORNL1]|uniref:hypothetical protein n=1 Tax=Roseimicrobium sp. ORNL1 TaxID=2711231 RepID=UPI0013E0FA6B|nr:hypothetical protein [Roseimicrobium sp. ORNL1]QIF05916.1 hypothetical protein G5S37_31995 [Roseimicrobium sp. ORNL1]